MARRLPFSSRERRAIAALLEKSLGPEYLSVRLGCGNVSLTYVEGWAMISLANRIFGFDGWSSSIRRFVQEYFDVGADGRVSVGYSCRCRVVLRDGTYKEDVGFGSSEGQRIKSAAVEKAKKEAATDALKRTLRLFGNALGNCVYDKSFLEGVRHLHGAKKTAFDSRKLLTRDDLGHLASPPSRDPPNRDPSIRESPSFDNSIFGNTPEDAQP